MAKGFAVTHFLSPKNSQALGRVMSQGNVPNSADFMVSNKIYAVFHVFGSFQFKVTFQNVFLFNINLKWFCVISKPKNLQSFLATEHAKLGLVKNY